MQSQEVVLAGITYDDIRRAVEEIIEQSKSNKTNLLYLDVGYMYNFHVSDIPFVRKFTEVMKQAQTWAWENNRWVPRNPKMLEWHRNLELWCRDEYVTIFDKKIKPIKILRSPIGRVVNEWMEMIAAAMAGFSDFAPMKFAARGDGATAGTTPAPSDTALVNELDRIDVTKDIGGGGMTVNGSVFMNVANFDRFSPSGDDTETGVFDAEKPGTVAPIIDDRMGDHSIYPDAIEHISGSDGPGSSTVVYQCSD